MNCQRHVSIILGAVALANALCAVLKYSPETDVIDNKNGKLFSLSYKFQGSQMKSYFAMLGNAINIRKLCEPGYANKDAFVILGDLITLG